MISLINKKKYVRPVDSKWSQERIKDILKFIDNNWKIDDHFCGAFISIDLLNMLYTVQGVIEKAERASWSEVFQQQFYLNTTRNMIPLRVHENLAGTYVIRTHHGFDCRETVYDFTDAFTDFELESSHEQARKTTV